MADAPVDFLGQRQQALLGQVVEEAQSVEEDLVGLLAVLALQVPGQEFDDLVARVVLEGLLDLVRLLDEVRDLRLHLVANLVLLAHPVEDLELALLGLLVLADGPDEGSHVADVVGQSDAAERLDEDQEDGLGLVGRRDVPEPHRQHDVRSPVVAPNVLGEPRGVGDVKLRVPVDFRVQVAHEVQEDGEEVAYYEVGHKHLEQTVVLLLLVTCDEQILKLLELA